MSFSSIASMLEAAKSADKPLYTVICEDDCQENNYTKEASHRQIQTLWEAMQQSSKQYCASDRSNSGFIGGDAEKLRLAAQAGALIGGTYLLRVIEETLKVAECNACMKRIVAAPTAGSCGILPAALITMQVRLSCRRCISPQASDRSRRYAPMSPERKAAVRRKSALPVPWQLPR